MTGMEISQAEDLLAAGAVALRDRLAQGRLTAVELVTACLTVIAAREPEIQAWAWLDADHALAQAEALDRRRAAGAALGPLHGLPVGLKDVIDTAGMPTENGTPADAGRVPQRDAWIVARLRAAGAVILGKTVTTEMAFLHPSRTRNPWNTAHSPGGSSAGSAAAVGAGMVPLAVGTQTGGSVIRPAAYCGAVGFKPSFGAIPRTGVLLQSHTLDTLGVFARAAADAALIAEVLFGHDPQDSATRPLPVPALNDAARGEGPAPRLAFLPPPQYDLADPEMVGKLEAFAAGLEGCETLPPLPDLEPAVEVRTRINAAEMAKYYAGYNDRHRDLLSEEMTAFLDSGNAVRALDYLADLDWRGRLNAQLDDIFDRCDAVLTPATTGPAPEGFATTGNAVYNGIWTLCGTPAITLPLTRASNGLPLGLQLVGRRGEDARLMRVAAWIERRIAG
ncbi:amidase [Acidimangrovimonas pyrenivorans]|uniref:Amidase n=1 Tax=Acidimangrovimonas pyrenivorans TaxID=2030798 RepID=A0ABV7AF59_9RHOB